MKPEALRRLTAAGLQLAGRGAEGGMGLTGEAGVEEEAGGERQVHHVAGVEAKEGALQETRLPKEWTSRAH